MSASGKIMETVGRMNLNQRIERVQIGMLYTAVQLETGAAGVAYSFPRKGCGPSIIGGGRSLSGRPVVEITRSLGSDNLADSSLALAAVNAVVSTMGVPQGSLQGDVLDAIEVRDGENVCMVGCFLPVVERLKTRRITVKSVDLGQKPGALPAGEAFSVLGESQIALITATSVINDTIDRLLEAAEHCREVVILGPSTPLVPPAFRDTPVTCLAGIRVEKPDEMFRIIGEGGGFRLFKSCVKKYTVRLYHRDTYQRRSPHREV
jgi:uncharacterized protein (DUF4213/DUF364 family)